jgi:signal transduction histidine kinase
MPRAASEPTSPADSFDRLPWGTHLCHLYRGEAELLSAAVPFMRAGLRNRERCLWVTSDPVRLREQVVGCDAEVGQLFASGQIDVVHHSAWQGDVGERSRHAIAGGYRGLRVSSDTACLGAGAYGGPVVALCSYPIEGCTSRGLLDLLHAHPQALVPDGVGWAQVDTGLLWVRDDVLSLLSHELKTPLASLRLRIDGLLRRLRARTLEPEEVEARLVMALEQCDRLDALVNNLLDVSRVSSGKLAVLLEPGDLGRIVRDTAERFGEEFDHRGALFTVETEEIHGFWDRTRVEQVVSNLVANAVRHAPGAPVEVRAYRRAAAAVIEVCDRGPGIPPDLADSVFERSGPIGARPGGGLGIGLWIVREIVSALGGTITLSTEAGRGCTFTVALPLHDELFNAPGARVQA